MTSERRYAGIEPTRLGPVLPQNNFNMGLPLVSLGGRGLAANLSLFYNSNVWGARVDPIQGTIMTFDPIQGWPSPGFTLGFGRIVYYDWQGDFTYAYMLIDPDGTRHSLGRGHQSNSNTLQTTDGTHISYVGSVLGGGTLYYQDGTKVTIGFVNNRLLPTQVTSTDGNFIQIAYKLASLGFPALAIDYVTDTLGRVTQFNYSGTSLVSISPPAGTTATFSYQNVTMNTNFYLAGAVENVGSSFLGISNVTCANRPPLSFTYSGYGMIYGVSWSSGGNGSVTFNYPTGGEALFGGPTFSQRTESATNSPTGIYTYSAGVITRPDGSKMTVNSGGVEIKNSAGVSFGKTVLTYANDPSGSPQVQSVTAYDDTNTPTKVDFDWDQNGNVVNKREYGWKTGGAWIVRRRTHYTYLDYQQYIDAYIRNRVSKVEVYDVAASDIVPVGKTEYHYDDYLALGGMESYAGSPEAPGHLTSFDSSYTTRGNVTGVTKWSDLSGGGVSTTHNRKVDKYGNLTKAVVSCCNQKSMTFGPNTYWSQPEQVTSGDPLGLNLTESVSYNFNDGTAASQTNPQGQTSSFTYDGAGRPISYALPTGANGSMSYNIWGLGTGSSFTYNDGGTNKTLVTSAVYNGWGEAIQTVNPNGAQVNIAYDAMGRVQSRTNPFPAGGTPGPLTTYQYDVLGRVTQVTLPDSNTVKTSYSGATMTITDQVNRKTKREGDGLGRMIKVSEQDTAGNLTQDTLYTYDIADRLIQVNQGGQYRTFKYDAEGRLLYEKIPEQTPTINDGTGTFWTSKYTYTLFGAVATKTDARGVITTNAYDPLNRLTSITYSIPAGVEPTNNVGYTYDNSPTSPTKGLLLSITMTGPLPTYTETFSYDSQKRVSSRTWSRDGLSYTTGYQYNAANELTQLTYPSGRVVAIGRDSKGRLSSVGSFLSSVSYNGIGQLTGTVLGNGVSESFTYDSQRMMLATQTAIKSANTLMNLTYGYQATAGQMGPGTTAGNAGQLMTITGTINGTTESANYAYDLWGRLVSASQTTNGTGAQRRFAYDRWGDRTSVWDAVSGGNQIQSVNLQQQPAGVPTNRIASVTSGTTINYFYDSAGNVTGAGADTYTYDGQNRIKGSSTATGAASYDYDYANRRIKKAAGGATTHYVWEGPQVIAEYNVTSGALLREYIGLGGSGMVKVENGATRYLLKDRLSARLILDSNGGVVGRQGHLPFGEELGNGGEPQKRRFTSYERDESGQDYAVNRQLEQSLGRFTRPDPYTGSYKSTNPQSLNRYSYVANDPVNFVDPSGLNLAANDGGGYDCTSYIYYGHIEVDHEPTGQGWIIGFTHCSYSPGSGSGSGGGQASPERALPAFDRRDRQTVNAAISGALNLTNNADCDTALAAFGTALGIDLSSLHTLVGRYQPTRAGTGPLGAGDNLFDGRHAQSLVPDSDPPHNLITAEEYFRKHGGIVTAFTFDQTLVFLGPRFFSETSYEQKITLIHEAAHLAGFNDSDFDSAPGRGDGSNRLTAYLKSKCPDR